jgi:CrcB protein
MALRELLLVGTGGFAGSIARYLIGGLVTQASGAARFPFATLVVNVTGCLVIGALAAFAQRENVLASGTRLFLFTGLLGGYTTFSAFAYETLVLGREHAWAAAAVNVLAQIALGLGAVWVGYRLGLTLTQ